MKKLIRWAVCLGLCLGLLVCGALAAESEISVQLDGQPLVFSDAIPQVKDQRTFLPLRAVFEAMGAEVNNEGNTITAVRGDKTLTMTIGSTEATVSENGVTTPITMDVAPYVDPSTWRTYVPVRFAAQAFDCAVGWDQGAKTAVIVDTEKLVRAATDGKTYTYLEKIAAMSDRYREGIWDMDMAFDADVTMFTMPLMTMDGAAKGVMEDNAKMDLTMNMKLDMDALLAMVGSMGGQQPSEEDLAQLAALKTDGVDMTLRGDMNTGKLYMNMDLSALGAALEGSGLDPAAWYELDMAALMTQAGMDWSQMMAMSENVDVMGNLLSSMSTANAPDDAVNGYARVKGLIDAIYTSFADQSFVEKDGALVSECSMDLGTVVNYVFTLNTDGDKLTGYSIAIGATETQDDQTMTMSVTVSMDDRGKAHADLAVNVNNVVAVTMTMDGGYTAGTTAPVVTPPDGAKVVSFNDLMAQTGDLGVIGGADGPTAILTGITA